MEYRYFLTDNTDPYMNLSMEQDLFRYAKRGVSILYLWQNADTIVIGKNQDIYSECRSNEFIRTGGKIARRMSGGGAVYHDLGNLNFSIINSSDDPDRQGYQTIIKKAMDYLGVHIEYNGRNDLLVENRKFSGNAFYDDGNVFCQHGTILISADIERMTYFLTPDASKLQRNHVPSVQSRVVNLSTVAGKITVETMKEALISSLNANQMDYVPDEKNLLTKYEKFSSREWIYGE
jgi:lipoate-protein ligase A